MTVTTTRAGQALIVHLDNAPVNAIGQPMRAGLRGVLDSLPGDVSRVILTGAGRFFAAGGDAREFDGPALEPHLNEVIRDIEASAIPWIAALNGPALGGGLELALACRYRIAAPVAQLGLPEVGLGIVPGSGGTQRLPRLIGMAKALEMIPTGKPVSAQQAHDMGLIDALADDPIRAAQALDASLLTDDRRISARPAPAPDAAALDAARATARRKQPQQIAPKRAIDLIAQTADTPLDQGLAAERAAFLELRASPEARALRHMFFAERAAKAPAGLTADPAPLDHIAVVGGGTMGAGIAYALLNAGAQVTLLETDADGVARARANVDTIIDASQERGLIDAEAAADRRARITISADYSAAAGASLAIEAAFESLEVKAQVFAQLEATLPPEAILASNTSYLDLDAIAATVADPARVIGLHFFAPAHIMKLLEIVQGAKTSDRALATGFALGKRLRKVPVLSGVCDGFIGNRILARYREAAEGLLLAGASVSAIDKAMTGFGYAMGPFTAQDLSGLDIAYANRRKQDATRDPSRRYNAIADHMVEAGRLGRKSGAGWYSYPGGEADDLPDQLAQAEAARLGVTRTALTEADIQDQLLAAMINEACHILDEGIAASAADIDLVTVFGYGFPRWRGGLMHYGQSLGAVRRLAAFEALAAGDPAAWQASPRLGRDDLGA